MKRLLVALFILIIFIPWFILMFTAVLCGALYDAIWTGFNIGRDFEPICTKILNKKP